MSGRFDILREREIKKAFYYAMSASGHHGDSNITRGVYGRGKLPHTRTEYLELALKAATRGGYDGPRFSNVPSVKARARHLANALDEYFYAHGGSSIFR